MKRTKCLSIICIGVICVLVFASCTTNTIDSGNISAQKLQVKGKITLSGNADPEGVFVWLDGIGINTRTDENGNFNLSLPPPASQSSTGGLEGVFKLYYYVANYGLETSEVLIQEGEFVYSKGDLNKEGELTTPKNLTQFLEIKTEVAPNSVPVNFGERIGATVTVTALNQDSVTVVFPNSIGGFLGAIFLRNVDTEEVHILSGPPTELKDKVLVDGVRHSRQLLFTISNNPLPIGKYEVIPYLWVAHERIPTELLSGLGTNVDSLFVHSSREQFLPAYLQIPMRRDVAIFEVSNE